MGFVVDVRSTRFELPKKKFPKALAALRKLAQERPGELEDPARTLAAKELVAALEANFWKLTLDEAGNATALELSADKLPRDAISPEAFLSALSRQVERGRVVFVSEGDPEHETVYTLGGALKSNYRNRERYVLKQHPKAPLPVAPGDRVTKTVTLVHQWGDELEIRPLPRDAERDVAVEIDGHPWRAGETREVRVTVGPDALGEAYAFVDAIAKKPDLMVDTEAITVDVTPREHVPLRIAKVEPQLQTARKYMMAAKDAERALDDVRAWAQKTKDAPGGAFLAKVAEAPDFVAAMKAAGLIAHQEGDKIKRLEPIVGRLPCSEWHLSKLLESFVERVRPYTDGGFGFISQGRPDRLIRFHYWYRIDRTVRTISR